MSRIKSVLKGTGVFLLGLIVVLLLGVLLLLIDVGFGIVLGYSATVIGNWIFGTQVLSPELGAVVGGIVSVAGGIGVTDSVTNSALSDD